MTGSMVIDLICLIKTDITSLAFIVAAFIVQPVSAFTVKVGAILGLAVLTLNSLFGLTLVRGFSCCLHRHYDRSCLKVSTSGLCGLCRFGLSFFSRAIRFAFEPSSSNNHFGPSFI